jgi:hypothetical protein
MDVQAGLLAGRERIAKAVLGVTDGVLNQGIGPETQGGPDCSTGVTDFRHLVTALKAAAIAQDGSAVDYLRLRESEAYLNLRACTTGLRALRPETLATRAERIAFWLNLYNSLVIDAVIQFDIRASVTEGWLGLLAFFRRAAYEVGGQRFSAEDIEHGVLRANRGHPYLPGPQFGPGDPRLAWVVSPVDPRIHFALNCASRSCPPVNVYESGKLEAQLNLATVSFIRTTTELDPSRGVLKLSRIFQWYADDFGGRQGVIEFVLGYLPEGEARHWLTGNRDRVELDYSPYDWTLNAVR